MNRPSFERFALMCSVACLMVPVNYSEAGTVFGIDDSPPGGGGSAIYEIDTDTLELTPLTTTVRVYCNGLAWDGILDRLYYVHATSLPDAELYFWDRNTDTHVLTGNVSDFVPEGESRIYGASFYRGSYYFISNRSDALYRIGFDDNDSIKTVQLLDNISGVGREWRFGDIAISPEGILYGSALNKAPEPDQGELFRYDLRTHEFTWIRQDPYTTFQRPQLAFGEGETLFGAYQSEWYVVDIVNGDLTSLGSTSVTFDDLANGVVPEPSTFTLLCIGALVIGVGRLRWKQTK